MIPDTGEMADPASLVMMAAACAAISGVPALFLQKNSALGQKLAAVFVAVGAVCGLVGSLWTILSGRSVAPTHEHEVAKAQSGHSAVADLDEASLLSQVRNAMRQR